VNPRLIVLLAAAGMLAGVVAWDVGQRAAKPAAAIARGGAEAMAPALERPLFAPSRRPAAEAPTAKAETPAQTFRLLGVAYSEGVGVAVIEVDGARARLKRGQSIAGWRLAEIGPRRAVLVQGETRKVLTF
jgi:hypothetical protein